MIDPRKKLFIWFTLLVLVMACVPAMVTPLPPLDANAINTFIAQTANAASAKTQAAIPTLTATAPFTPTLRSTFTPEPTLTTVPTYIFPTLTPVQRLQYFRVKHDNQLAMYDYRSRTAADDWKGVNLLTPETVPMLVLPRDGTGTHRTILDSDWETYLNALNGNDKRKLRYLKADNTAIFNSSGFPKLESLTMGGNLIAASEVQGDWVRVNTIDFANPGTLKEVNYTTRPDLVHKFVIVAWKKSTRSTYWLDPPQGPLYWPLVSSRPVWLPLERLEPFPHLPTVVTAVKTQKIRKTPSTDGKDTGLEFLAGDYERIIEYYPSGPNVWARLDNGGWIALQLNWENLTDWKMETLPPP